MASRFGRLVPDIQGLTSRLSAFSSQAATCGRTLDVHMGTHLQVLGEHQGRTMAFCGRESTQKELLERGIPSYILTDRRERDHRRLVVTEADRVVAEALGVAVPRPMSDETRRGFLLACIVKGADRARAQGASALAIDTRADWLLLGDTMLLYCEQPELVEEVRSHGGRVIAADVKLGEVALTSDGVSWRDAVVLESAVASTLKEERAIEWLACRRAVLGQPIGAQANVGPPVVFHEEPGLRVVAYPYADCQTEDVIAILDAGDDCSIPEDFGLALRKAGIASAVLWITGEQAKPSSLRRFLWDSELNNVALVALEDPTADTPTPPWARHLRLLNLHENNASDFALKLAAARQG